MSELYWLTRLDSLHNWLSGLVFVGIALVVISIFCFFTDAEFSDQINFKRFKKLLISGITIILISTLIKTFIPTTNDAFLIYGVGGTLDYLQNDSVAMQIPSKCIEAADKWLDALKK